MAACATQEERWAAAKAYLLAGASSGASAGVPAAASRVKLCGMFREQDIDAVRAARPDFCGFIVNFPKSHRSVTPEHVAQLTARMGDASIWRVGVFVDAPAADIAHIVRTCGLDLVQLHGHETPADVAAVRTELPEVGIIQAFRVNVPADVARACESKADMVLLDNGQGTGEAFDWSLTAQATRPFMLAGGLGPDNVARAIEQVHPWGVDMSSGIETGKLKDPGKMKAAVAAVREAACVAQRGETL